MGSHRTGTVRALQGERTRERLIEAASELFVRNGYADTSLDAVVERAGVTKGALYHHFADKRALYLGAYDAAHPRLAQQIAELATDGRGRAPFEVFVDACVAFLQSVITEPWVMRLTVAEGPGAMGNAEWRALDDGYAWDTIGVPLEQMQARGTCAPTSTWWRRQRSSTPPSTRPPCASPPRPTQLPSSIARSPRCGRCWPGSPHSADAAGSSRTGSTWVQVPPAGVPPLSMVPAGVHRTARVILAYPWSVRKVLSRTC